MSKIYINLFLFVIVCVQLRSVLTMLGNPQEKQTWLGTMTPRISQPSGQEIRRLYTEVLEIRCECKRCTCVWHESGRRQVRQNIDRMTRYSSNLVCTGQHLILVIGRSFRYFHHAHANTYIITVLNVMHIIVTIF